MSFSLNWLPLAHLFYFLGNHVMACNMGNIPFIPDKALDNEFFLLHITIYLLHIILYLYNKCQTYQIVRESCIKGKNGHLKELVFCYTSALAAQAARPLRVKFY